MNSLLMLNLWLKQRVNFVPILSEFIKILKYVKIWAHRIYLNIYFKGINFCGYKLSQGKLCDRLGPKFSRVETFVSAIFAGINFREHQKKIREITKVYTRKSLYL